MQEMAEFHSVHVWHKNICQYDINRMFLHKLRCLLPILAVSHQLAVHAFPVNVFFYCIPDEDFVIYKQYSVHLLPPFFVIM